jgi:pimeloyl-ACP methyl ester carboxylesterase
MPYADVNGQRIRYEDTGGDGPAVILAHGFLMDRTMFAPQLEALAPEFRVIAWDERGFGETEFDGAPFTYWDSAKDVLGLMDALGVDSAVVGGMSQGGFVSLRAALLAPERVRALVLIDTQAGTEKPENRAGYQEMLDTWVSVGPVDELANDVAALILSDPALNDEWIAKWRARPKEGLAEPGRCLMDRDDVTDRLGEIACPAIVFHGTEDVAIEMELAEALCEGLPDCRGLIRVEGAAHAANLTHADRVNPPLLEFLRGL